MTDTESIEIAFAGAIICVLFLVLGRMSGSDEPIIYKVFVFAGFFTSAIVSIRFTFF